MFEPFILRALIAGLLLAIVSGMLGCFIVWRKMAYFGDSLAHSALLGVALGLAGGFSINIGVTVICFAFALLLLYLQKQKLLATDTLLGILAHAALSIGVVTISLLGQRFDLHVYLFGDILTVTTQELWWIFLGGAIIIGLLVLNWSSLVLMTIHEDLARAENVNIFFTHMLLMLLMAIVVSISIRIVGILLITSMLIIPAATARQLVRSPETMAVMAAFLGGGAVVLGLYASVKLDTPSGPSIVFMSAFLFAIFFMLKAVVKKLKP
ncbi:MAG: metal ABC transporter permease [Pseudomonadota bacterium]